MKNLLFTFLMLNTFVGVAQETKRPNVLLIITDDQGYGDLSFTGNPHIKTDVLDKFAKESIRLNNFYVSPVCAPTRSSLMTGRYSLRTGVHDTYNGGAIMASNEVTIAEMLKQANYTTGIFGKWHLGDNYPSRPDDQGFDESVIHHSGGMGQVGDITTYFKKDSSYFDPVLWHNGKREAYEGYCSDIFAEEAIDFIEKHRNSPFFCYLSFNAPHTPLQVPDKYYQMYKSIDPASGFEDDKRPFSAMSEKDKVDARKVYAMVTNIDDNIGKVLKKLDELNIAKNTLVIFMTDNGPQQTRYLAGMRGLKSSVYRGGVRVPFFMKLPSHFEGDKDIATTTAHIDILPTLAEICDVAMPKSRIIDGKNLLPVIKGEPVDWTDRSLFFYWTRKYPELYKNVALQKGRYKLVGQAAYNADILDFELFDIDADPYEQNNIVKENTGIAKALKYELDQNFHELVNSENLVNGPRIFIGNEHENPTFLTRNDAEGERKIWHQGEVYGKWRVSIAAGNYNIKYKFLNPVKANGIMYLETRTFINQMTNEQQDAEYIEMKNVYLPEMECDFIPFYMVDSKRILPFWVEIEKIG